MSRIKDKRSILISAHFHTWKCHTWNHGQFLSRFVFFSFFFHFKYSMLRMRIMRSVKMWFDIWRCYHWIDISMVGISSKVCKIKWFVSILDGINHDVRDRKKTRLIHCKSIYYWLLWWFLSSFETSNKMRTRIESTKKCGKFINCVKRICTINDLLRFSTCALHGKHGSH